VLPFYFTSPFHGSITAIWYEYAAYDQKIEGPYYRCNGQMHERGIFEGKCQGKSIKGPVLEKVVWDDIERFLRDPGDILDELSKECEMNPQAARDEKERVTLDIAIRQIAGERQNAIRLGIKGTITDDELAELLVDNDRREAAVNERLNAIMASMKDEPEPIDEDMLVKIWSRLDHGLTDEERQEIVALLVKRITINTEIDERGKKQATAVVEYRFSKTVATNCTGRGSWPPLESSESARYYEISCHRGYQTKQVHTDYANLVLRRGARIYIRHNIMTPDLLHVLLYILGYIRF